jgi:hypothetical protein
MANRVLTADIIAKEAVMILENTCVMGGLVYRGYEDEFAKQGERLRKGRHDLDPPPDRLHGARRRCCRRRRTCRKASSP